MKTFIAFTISLLLPFYLCSQTTELDTENKNKWIDGISIIPLNAQIVLSELNNKIFEEGKTPYGFSIHPQLLLQKELNSTLDIFLGIGYSNNSESAKIRKDVSTFSDLTNIGWNDISNEDSSFQIKTVNYRDEYFTVPIGLRYYPTPRVKKAVRMVLSSKLEFSFLIDSKADVDVVDRVESGFFRLITSQPVFNTQYEKDAEAYFADRNEDFLLNFQFGVGYEWRSKGRISLGHELVMNSFLKNHKTDLLKDKVMIGMQLRLVYHFD
ncbi:MAG: hypothetical protein AB8F94_18940 [Saprospiraceae bacterium]